MSKRSSLVLSLGAAAALMTAASAFAQSSTTTPGDAKMKNAPSADAMGSTESPRMSGKSMRMRRHHHHHHHKKMM